MTTGHVFIAQSFDGFIARKDDDIDWLMKYDGGDDNGYDSFASNIDGLIMGRGTYEKVLQFDPWPYTKPVTVMSRTLNPSDVPDKLQDKVQIVNLTPIEVMKAMSEKGWKRAYIDGGKLIQSFLRDGLIEDMIVTTIPVLIGDGIPLFGELKQDVDLDLVGVKSLKPGFVQTHYNIAK